MIVFFIGAGFTDHSTATMKGQAKQVMMQTLSPDIKKLINTDITEEENQNLWAIAIGKVEYVNLCQAHDKHPDRSIMYALTGQPDDEFPVQWMEWKEYVFKTDLFTNDKKWNGSSYTKEQLEKIVGQSINDDDICYDE